MIDPRIRICLLAKQVGVANAIACALDSDFETRHRTDFDLNKWADWQEWCDVIVLDMRHMGKLGEFSAGVHLIDEIQRTTLRPPIIVICDESNTDLIVQVTEHGVYDVISDGLNIATLRRIIRRAHKIRSAERELETLRSAARGSGRMHELLGTAPAMQELFALAQKFALCDVNVLITGETGTGKELLARAIHQMSARKAHPMVIFCCTNLPETLIEDDLFGHEKGAFTGALMPRRGRIEMADQGTLFLDEIGDLGIASQPKLLRVLQERAFERLGGNTTVNVDVRLIAATNRNLAEMVQSRKFREDLYYRLNVAELHLCPLRERRDDIALLAHHFLQVAAQRFNKKVKKFSYSALRTLEEYVWPGNVRELENAIQRAAILCDGHSIETRHLPIEIRNADDEPVGFERSYNQEVRDFKRRLVLRTLRQCDWSKVETARVLGIARAYLHRLINQLNIHESEDQENAENSAPHNPGQDELYTAMRTNGSP
jgi:DNA-binding NtrC family response regulator